MEKEVRFGTRNVRSLSRSGSHSTVARELDRNKSDLEEYRKLGGTNGALQE